MKLGGAEEPLQGAPEIVTNSTQNNKGFERCDLEIYYKSKIPANHNAVISLSGSALKTIIEPQNIISTTNYNGSEKSITICNDMRVASNGCSNEETFYRLYNRLESNAKYTDVIKDQIKQEKRDINKGNKNLEIKNLCNNLKIIDISQYKNTYIGKCDSFLNDAFKVHKADAVTEFNIDPGIITTNALKIGQQFRFFNIALKLNTKSNSDKNVIESNALKIFIKLVSISMLHVQQYFVNLKKIIYNEYNKMAACSNFALSSGMRSPLNLYTTASGPIYLMQLKVTPLTILMSAIMKPNKLSSMWFCLLQSTLARRCFLHILLLVLLLPSVHSDDNDNFFAVNSFSMGPETTTPEFDYASRGQKKFGDKCENTLECGFPGSICDSRKKSCQCTEDLPVTNHIDKCGKEAAVNESCFFNEQCEVKYFQTECRDGRCACRFEMTPIWAKDGTVECKAGRQDKRGPETYVDPAMIGVLVGMALMFIIICVVLRLFSQARWRENRTIFNTPNPRLMNVSLLRDSKLLHGQERRGSRMSVRAPSRQPSMASLRPHSPNPSLGKTGSRSGSASASNASAASVRSTRSNSVAPGNVVNTTCLERKGSQYQQPLITNITSNPVAESVTVEIIEPVKRGEN